VDTQTSSGARQTIWAAKAPTHSEFESTNKKITKNTSLKHMLYIGQIYTKESPI
jgi:hypothetical protein